MLLGAVEFGVVDYSAMVIYMVAVVGLGIFFVKKENTSAGFLLGGRNIPWWAVGISYMMSLLSTVSLVIIPGEIFNHGASMFVLGVFLGPILAPLMFMLFMRFYFKLKSFTPFEYLERRYDTNLRTLVGGIYFWTRLFYMAMVLFSTSKVFEGGAGWPAWLTIILVGVVGIGYTVMGGMKAVVWTDVLQFLVLVVGLGLTAVICCRLIGSGPVDIVSYAFDKGHGLPKFSEPSFYQFDPYVRLSFWILLLDAIMAPIFYNCADQISIQRLLSTSGYKQAKKAIWLNALVAVPMGLVLCFLGFAVFTYYSQFPDTNVIDGDTAFFTFISSKLPSPLPGLIFAAMLAAVMSTLDSGINSLSTVWLKEFHERFVDKSISEARQVKASRWMTVAVGTFAIVMALMISYTADLLGQSVVEAQVIFTALGVVTVPVFLFAVLSKRANSRVVWAMTFLCWGINFGMTTWYWKTRQTPEYVISSSWLYIMAAAALVLLCLRFVPSRYELLTVIKKNLWLVAVGWALSFAFWLITVDSSGPGQLSFQWVGLPGTAVYLIGGGIWTLLSKTPPKEKYDGLTLLTYTENEADHDS